MASTVKNLSLISEHSFFIFFFVHIVFDLINKLLDLNFGFAIFISSVVVFIASVIRSLFAFAVMMVVVMVVQIKLYLMPFSMLLMRSRHFFEICRMIWNHHEIVI